jgi:hypothetical protein
MAAYNLMKQEDRKRMREDRLAEIQAVQNGTWPRDIDDSVRWSKGTPEYARRMCQDGISYLDDLEFRIDSKAPDLEGYWSE